tara:strand:+ start:2504 stop:2668 length:165 start_codon:yes stop_codon:yes gene_type:complete
MGSICRRVPIGFIWLRILFGLPAQDGREMSQLADARGANARGFRNKLTARGLQR